MQGQRCDLHDVADVERVDPLVLVQIAQDVFHIGVAHLQTQTAAQT